MPTPKRLPSSFHFKSQYSAPTHRNEDRLSQVDFRTFDPFVPEARQTVANCKKHRRQRHELSDKCKHVLAIVDAQERLLSTRPEAQQSVGYSAQGAPMNKPEISIEFGDGIPEIAKEYVKFWIEQSGMVKEPHSRQYDVHTIEDQHNHSEKPSIVLMAPFIDTDMTDENKSKAFIRAFFEQPNEFAAKNKVGNLRIYSTNKKTYEEDAVGYLNYLPIKIIGKEVITKNLQKTNVEREGLRVNPTTNLEEWTNLTENRIRTSKRKMAEAEENLKNPPEGKTPEQMQDKFNAAKKEYLHLTDQYQEFASEPMKREISTKRRQLRAKENAKEEHKKTKEYRDKQEKIFTDMLSVENNVAPNRMGEGTNPLGYAVQAAETVPRTALNVINQLVSRSLAQKERKEELEYQEKMKEIDSMENDLKNTKFTIPESPEQRETPKAPPGKATEESVGEEKEPIFNPTTINSSNVEEKTEQGVGDLPITAASEIEQPAQQSIQKPPIVSEKKAPKTPSEEQIKARSEDVHRRFSGKEASAKYLNTSDMIIIAKLKRRGV